MAAAILLAATFAMFADVLFVASPKILSHESADLASQYVHWRAFGFGELQSGNLALWNPHIYLGSPYLGGFQSALLYPPNWIYLFLPLPLAINWGIASHVFLTGFFTFLWARHRGVVPIAALLSGLLAMFCGAHFLHVYAGHLSNLCTMAWAPLFFLAIDGWFRDRSSRWLTLGAVCVALQILAGHPQYVFYTSVAAAVYSALCLARCSRRPSTSIGLFSMFVLGTGLAAVQLFPGIEAAGESVRSGGTTYEFAASFSFPPESFVTLVSPFFFGDGTSVDYWGRAYPWEVGIFVGVTGVFLALLAAARAERSTRRFSVTMILVLAILALGSHTPLFRLLYHWVPGFDQFRGNAKFAFQASIFVALLAGIGLDRAIREPGDLRRAAAAVVAVAVLCACVATWIQVESRTGDPEGRWAAFMHSVWRWGSAGGDAYLDETRYRDVEFVREAGQLSALGLYVCATTASILAALLRFARNRPRAIHAVAALAVLEVFVAARATRPTFEMEVALMSPVDWSALAEGEEEGEGDVRILDPLNPNRALSTGDLDVWGYDPGVSRRYAEFMTATQGVAPDEASQYVTFAFFPHVYAMLRLRHALLWRGDGLELFEGESPLPRLIVVHEHREIAERDEIFRALGAEGFDPRRTVILESSPTPPPEAATDPEDVRLIDSSTDHLTIEAQLSAPGLLLVTDGYSPGWVARGLPGSVQRDYEVLPANYVLRAVPMEAGHHRLRLEYAPASFRYGLWITLVALLAAALLAMHAFRDRAHARQ